MPRIPERPLSTLKRRHPRLIASDEEMARVKELRKESGEGAEFYRRLKGEADRIMEERPVRYEIPDGLRLLGVSRTCLRRIYVLATLFRLEGDLRYKERAMEELKAAAHFPDWNPRHFLDTAEMTHAFAIGYDWLYDALSEDERAMIRDAIVEKGLKPALEVYKRGGWWAVCNHNWNQVCNGGIVIGALAIAEEIPKLADEILSHALSSVQIAMRMFDPDGGWAEGPGYWGYATSYNVFMLAALNTALGTDFGLSEMPGFSETGYFPIYITGPTGKTFNFADAHDNPPHAPQMFWLARKFNRPIYGWYEKAILKQKLHPLDLIWFDPRETDPVKEGLPLDRYFENVGVVSMRSSWSDSNALFVAFKGGDNKANHSHLDLGTFVLDALGHRWAVDLGPDDYNIPGYFGSKRWSYYRLRSEGHNVITFDGANQDPVAKGAVIRFESETDFASAAVDLSEAYAQFASKVIRTISMPGRRRVLIEDLIELKSESIPVWNMHTPAEIGIDGRTALLRRGDAALRVEVIEPENALLEARDLSLPPPQRPIRGIRKLMIKPAAPVNPLRIKVLLSPGG